MPETSLQGFREQFPEYNDLTDKQVLSGFHKNHYSDLSYDDFIKKFNGKFGGESVITKESESVWDVVKERIAPTFTSGLPLGTFQQPAAMLESAFKAAAIPQEALIATAPIGAKGQQLEPTFAERLKKNREFGEVLPDLTLGTKFKPGSEAVQDYLKKGRAVQETVGGVVADPIMLPVGKMIKPVTRIIKALTKGKKTVTAKKVVETMARDKQVKTLIKVEPELKLSEDMVRDILVDHPTLQKHVVFAKGHVPKKLEKGAHRMPAAETLPKSRRLEAPKDIRAEGEGILEGQAKLKDTPVAKGKPGIKVTKGKFAKQEFTKKSDDLIDKVNQGEITEDQFLKELTKEGKKPVEQTPKEVVQKQAKPKVKKVDKESWEMTPNEFNRFEYGKASQYDKKHWDDGFPPAYTGGKGKHNRQTIEHKHMKLIEQAIKEGKPVSPNVLKDYPYLMPKPVSKTETLDDLYKQHAKAKNVEERTVLVNRIETLKNKGRTVQSGKDFTVGLSKAIKKDIKDPSSGIVADPHRNLRQFLKENKMKLTDEEMAKMHNFAKGLAKTGASQQEQAVKLSGYIETNLPKMIKVAETVRPENWNSVNRAMRGIANQNKVGELELHNILEKTASKRSFKDASVDEIKGVIKEIEKKKVPGNVKYEKQRLSEINKVEDVKVKKDLMDIEGRSKSQQKSFEKRREQDPDVSIFAKKKETIFTTLKDNRYVWETAEENTGYPFKKLGDKTLKGGREIRKTADDKLESVFKDTGLKVNEVVGFKQAEDAIKKYIVKGGDIDPKYKKVADNIIDLLKAEEKTVRRIRFDRWMETGEKIPNASDDVLNQGKKILLEQGDEAFDTWLTKQTWGTRKDYLPSMFETTAQLDDFTENIFKERSKGQFKARKGDYYNTQPLFRTLRRYFLNMESYKKLKPLKGDLEKMLDDAGASFRDVRNLQTWWKRLNGFNVANDPASQIINKVRSYFWRGILNNNAYIYARNLFQNTALLGQKMGLRGIAKHGWKLFKPEVRLTGDKTINKAMKEYFDTYISELSGLSRDYFFVESSMTKYKFTKNAKRVLEYLPQKYGITDLFNRLKAFRIIYDNAADNLKLFRGGKITNRKLMLRTGGYNLTNLQQKELLLHLAKKNDDMFLKTLSGHIVENTHFKYTRFEKGLFEQSATGQHIADTFTWFKGNIQNLYKGGVERFSEGVKKKNYTEAYAGLRTLVGYFVAAEGANYAMGEMLGKGKSNYGVGSFKWGVGGVGLNTLMDIGDLGGFIDAVSTGDTKKGWGYLAAIGSVNKLARLVPFVDVMINSMEAAGDTKGLNAWKIMKSMINNKLEGRDANRTAVESWQHVLFGTEEQGSNKGRQGRKTKNRRTKRR